MSVRTTANRKCLRCGTAIDSCAFCDEPDCPAISCYRCVGVAVLDSRMRPRSTAARQS